MKKIAVITATRAEYGLLSLVIKQLRKYENSDFRVDLIVTGTHLSEVYGRTIEEIDDRIDYRVQIDMNSRDERDIALTQSEILVKFTELFMNEDYNAVVILGDRYEMLAIAIAAGNTHTAIFHLCGGDTSEGAIDEWIRHSITKMSYLHFVTNEDSRKRVVQLGENPERVFNYGSTSVDNILLQTNMSKRDALHSIGLDECTYALCTYHPVTMEMDDVDLQIANILEVIGYYDNIQFVVTKANADQGGARINEIFEKASTTMPNLHVYSSLGVRRYLAIMKYATFVIGNSSSGIIEAPVFHVPTVNIGDRQKGRLMSESIINCDMNASSIIRAVQLATSKEFKRICNKVISPYGNGNAARRIAKKIVDVVVEDRINLKKSFYILKQ